LLERKSCDVEVDDIEHLQRAISLVDKTTDLASSHQFDVRQPLVFALSYDSWALWLLGYPDRALRASAEALAIGARLGHPHTLAFALHFSSVLRQLRREAGVIQAQADTVIALSTEHGLDLYRALGVIMRGWALAERGNVDDGLADIRRGLAERLETGMELGRPFVLGLLAATHARAGQPEEALQVLAEAIALGRERAEHAWEPELLRQKGEVLLADAARDLDEAERSFREAIACSRGQSMRSWELRAAMSLGRLLVRRIGVGKRATSSSRPIGPSPRDSTPRTSTRRARSSRIRRQDRDELRPTRVGGDTAGYSWDASASPIRRELRVPGEPQ
jgi:predicted ATPase